MADAEHFIASSDRRTSPRGEEVMHRLMLCAIVAGIEAAIAFALVLGVAVAYHLWGLHQSLTTFDAHFYIAYGVLTAFVYGLFAAVACSRLLDRTVTVAENNTQAHIVDVGMEQNRARDWVITRLALRTYANWVDKTANLLTDEYLLGAGDVIRVELPPHWLGTVFLGAAHTAGVAVTTDPATAAHLVVRGPDRLEQEAPDVPVVACSLTPFATPFDRPLPEVASLSLAPVTDWMLENLRLDLSVDQLAAKAHMSPRTFARRFKADYGATPAAWLARQRIIHAQRLLEKTDLGLDRIAYESGFGSAAVLRQNFARVLDTTPTAYRARFCCTREAREAAGVEAAAARRAESAMLEPVA